MFKQLLLAGSLVIGGVAIGAPAASAAPLRAPIQLTTDTSIENVQYYYPPPRRRYARPHYAPPRYRRRYYARPYYPPPRYFVPPPYYAPRPYYGVRPYYGPRVYYR